MYPLAIATLLVSAADHWTTYVCLRAPVPNWHVTEANPLADWLFQNLGLVNGLLLDSGLTLAAVAFLITTPRLPDWAKRGVFTLLIGVTGFAAVSNYQAIRTMGLSLFGAAG